MYFLCSQHMFQIYWLNLLILVNIWSAKKTEIYHTVLTILTKVYDSCKLPSVWTFLFLTEITMLFNNFE